MSRDPALPEPDFTDPFAPDPDAEQELHCLQCDETFPEAAVIYDDRHGQRLWWCPNPTCDGRGVGIDLVALDEDTPTEGLVAPDRDDVPQGYRSKTIPLTTLPDQWRIAAEERNHHEIINRYHHEYLDVQVKIAGVRIGADEPMEYKLWITTPADAPLEYDIPVNTADDMTEFDAGRATATGLMEQIDHAARAGEGAAVQTALHQLHPDQHQAPATPDRQTDPELACPVCEMDADLYRGDSPAEMLQAHRTHMADDAHAEADPSE